MSNVDNDVLIDFVLDRLSDDKRLEVEKAIADDPDVAFDLEMARMTCLWGQSVGRETQGWSDEREGVSHATLQGERQYSNVALAGDGSPEEAHGAIALATAEAHEADSAWNDAAILTPVGDAKDTVKEEGELSAGVGENPFALQATHWRAVQSFMQKLEIRLRKLETRLETSLEGKVYDRLKALEQATSDSKVENQRLFRVSVWIIVVLALFVGAILLASVLVGKNAENSLSQAARSEAVEGGSSDIMKEQSSERRVAETSNDGGSWLRVSSGVEVPFDGTDNDGDGDVDFSDTDLLGFETQLRKEYQIVGDPFLVAEGSINGKPYNEVPFDGIDNDGNGLVDSCDSYCYTWVFAGAPKGKVFGLEYDSAFDARCFFVAHLMAGDVASLSFEVNSSDKTVVIDIDVSPLTASEHGSDRLIRAGRLSRKVLSRESILLSPTASVRILLWPRMEVQGKWRLFARDGELSTFGPGKRASYVFALRDNAEVKMTLCFERHGPLVYR